MRSWHDLCKEETQESVQLLLYARVTEEHSVGVTGSRNTPYVRGESSYELLRNN